MANDGAATAAELLAYRRRLAAKREQIENIRSNMRETENIVDWTSNYADRWRRKMSDHRKQLARISGRISQLEVELLDLSRQADA